MLGIGGSLLGCRLGVQGFRPDAVSARGGRAQKPTLSKVFEKEGP